MAILPCLLMAFKISFNTQNLAIEKCTIFAKVVPSLLLRQLSERPAEISPQVARITYYGSPVSKQSQEIFMKRLPTGR